MCELEAGVGDQKLCVAVCVALCVALCVVRDSFPAQHSDTQPGEGIRTRVAVQTGVQAS